MINWIPGNRERLMRMGVDGYPAPGIRVCAGERGICRRLPAWGCDRHAARDGRGESEPFGVRVEPTIDPVSQHMETLC